MWLYQEYLNYILRYEWSEPAGEIPDRLTPTQFGAALRRVFDMGGERDRKTHKRVNGKQVWGYWGVKGPRSLTVGLFPGRRKGSKNGQRKPVG